MSWGNTLLAGLSRPPDPDVVGPGWRDTWLMRLDALEQPIGIWLSHQHRDAYWKPGSVCEDYSPIKAAVYAVSGWQDSYSRNVLPLLEGLQTPQERAHRPLGAFVAASRIARAPRSASCRRRYGGGTIG